AAVRRLQHIDGLTVSQGELLQSWTHFRAGGPADLLVQPSTCEGLAELKKLCISEHWPLTVLGRATNILVSDLGIRGITAILSPSLGGVRCAGESLICQAGVPLYEIAAMAARLGLSGFEFACGIPGSAGGAVVMNAGAFEGSMSGLVTRTEFINAQGEIRELIGDEHDFSYRHSYFSNEPEAMILEIVIRLNRAPANEIYDRMADFARKRYQTQPLASFSAGSAFRRPDGYFAGKLISDAGMKGYTRGRAGVSAKHAGFIVNHGGATAREIARIFSDVRRAVFDVEGVLLQPEVRLVGEWEGDPFAF
ncbi:MAG: UDP-N-acetylmuramate dehydrogenase, partial [Clostridiaceae bacterium]|nr:UDP-N-acetylmuramate dehydrogenase [Clostridiaceae bacterium]